MMGGRDVCMVEVGGRGSEGGRGGGGKKPGKREGGNEGRREGGWEGRSEGGAGKEVG